MIKILKRSPRSRAQPECVPAGLRVYAIGDVHGRADLLRNLIGQIERDDAGRAHADTLIVFLGDLIDRGPDSADVVDMAINLARRHSNTRFLMGNHEEVFLRVIDGDNSAVRFFDRIGGRETMLSYGLTNDDLENPDDAMVIARLREKVPMRHIEFLRGFEDIIIAGDYLFVHAGIRPGVALEQQSVSDLRWIREPFLGHRQLFDQMVVHGHTITSAIDAHPHRIGIDTGAYETGRLTALGLEGTARWELAT